MMRSLTLDVGCGGNGEYRDTTTDFRNTDIADVNVDIRIIKARVPNRVKAALPYLPFREKALTHVICSHVLEHLQTRETVAAVKELRRIARDVEIRVPVWMYAGWPDHQQILVRGRLRNLPWLLKWLFFIPVTAAYARIGLLRWLLRKKLFHYPTGDEWIFKFEGEHK